MEARVLQDLELGPTERVLEIGTGSGYLSALLAARAAEVVSVEINPRLAHEAGDRLARAGIGNVEVLVGNAARGWGRESFDVIVLTGSTPVLPDAFLEQLAPEGRLFAVVGDAPVMKARLVRRTAPQTLAVRELFETVIDPLQDAAAPARFDF
jgi:protein-L-isoaspartate(D-aspartate) O-methyltransferase